MLVCERLRNAAGPANPTRPGCRCSARRGVGSQVNGQVKGTITRVKAPAADGLGDRPPQFESQETSAPIERGPASILIWGKPMQIDTTWEEMFMRRERRSK